MHEPDPGHPVGKVRRPERWGRLLRWIVAVGAVAVAGAWITGSFAGATVAHVTRGEDEWDLLGLALAGAVPLLGCAWFSLRGRSLAAAVSFLAALALFVVWMVIVDSARWELFWSALWGTAGLACAEGFWVRGHPLLAGVSLVMSAALITVFVMFL